MNIVVYELLLGSTKESLAVVNEPDQLPDHDLLPDQSLPLCQPPLLHPHHVQPGIAPRWW